MTPRTVAPMGRKSTSACQATKAVSEGATSVAVILWTSSHVSGRGSPSLSFAGRAKNSCKLSRAHDAERDLHFYQSFGLSLLPASCQIARLSKIARAHRGIRFQSSFGPARKLPVCTKRVCERLLLSAFRNSAFMCKSLPRLRPKLVGNRRRHRRLFRRRRGPSGLLLLRRGQRGMYRRLLHGRNSKTTPRARRSSTSRSRAGLLFDLALDAW